MGEARPKPPPTRANPVARFLAIGECMAELSSTATSHNYRLGFAGDTFNTAWYLRRLRDDAHVTYFTAVGSDTLSDQMLQFVGEAGIDASGIQRIDGLSIGLYLISVNQGERSFSYWRSASAARKLACDQHALTTAISKADQIYYSGITLAILDSTSRTTLFDALQHAGEQGKTVIFDPNLRPALWEDEATMRTTIMDGAGVSSMVLPSYEDEARFFGDVDPQATIRRYVEAGSQMVIVKNGGASVHYWNRGDQGLIDVPAIDHVVDTTAAGDSFNAGFIDGLNFGLPVSTSIIRACSLAAKVIQGQGALVAVSA